MKPLDYVNIGKRIQKLRKLKGLTQEQLSEKADISTNYLSDLERAKSEGSLGVYYRIASALQIGVDFLIDISIPAEAETYLIYKIRTMNDLKQKILNEFMDFLEHLETE